MGILLNSKSRFENSNKKSIRCIKIEDQIYGMFIESCYQLLRSLSNNEPEQVDLRIKTVGLYYRFSSYLGSDYSSAVMDQMLTSEVPSLVRAAKQYEASEPYAIRIEKSLDRMVSRNRNFKREAIDSFLSKNMDSDISIISRGHKWRTIAVEDENFLSRFKGCLTFDSYGSEPLDTVILPISPHLLSKRLIREVYFGGGARNMVLFLFNKEKIKLPDIQTFISSYEEQDIPLIPKPDLSIETISPISKSVQDIDGEEIEIDDDGSTGDASIILKLLLASNEEIRLSPFDHVWCSDDGYLINLHAVEIFEGMKILLRADLEVEKPELYLDRSESWRTPLRNTVNLGISPSEIARNVEHKAGITVNGRMVRSWIDGDVLGPEDQVVFYQLIDELKNRGFIAAEHAKDETEIWWNDLVKARAAQSSKGMKNRSEILKEAERMLASDPEAGKDSPDMLCEFSEILVIERCQDVPHSIDNLGVSNHRKMRAFS